MSQFDGKFGNPLISASLVWDGGSEVRIPHQMGAPRADQMQGTPAECLSELSGRVCYDSLGKGRPSFTCEVVTGADPHTGEQIAQEVEGYHDHILKVGHGSVLEHFNFTVEITPAGEPPGKWPQPHNLAFQMLNRPGCFTWMPVAEILRITLNLRSVLEFDKFTHKFSGGSAWELDVMLRTAAHQLAPNIIKTTGEFIDECKTCEAKIVDPINDNEKWVSLFVSGSRGMSHELVRHGDFTAISQRSTRFVDESESPWVRHPLEDAWHSDDPTTFSSQDINDVVSVDASKREYKSCVHVLEPWLIARGLDKTAARKQARGAARGYLGNALYTELIFSASVAQWKRILRQRASVFADAEIREVAVKAFAGLLESRYAASFDGWSVLPSPDGIGFVVQEPI